MGRKPFEGRVTLKKGGLPALIHGWRNGSFLPPLELFPLLNIHFLLFFCLSLLPGPLALSHWPLASELLELQTLVCKGCLWGGGLRLGLIPWKPALGKGGPGPLHRCVTCFLLEPSPGQRGPFRLGYPGDALRSKVHSHFKR